jgi:ActR/RegA family two-component response regulator
MRTIIVTGYPDLANAISAIKGAADDYVTIPANPAELIRIVRKHLQSVMKPSRAKRK